MSTGPAKVPTKTVTLAPAELNGKWGYIDKSGKTIIQFTFDKAQPFGPNGLAAVKNSEGKWGYIHTDGSYAISPTFESDAYGNSPIGDFTVSGLAPARNGEGKYGFINASGKYVIPADYDSVRQFADNGLAAVSQNGLWGYINTHGKMVLPCKYSDAGDFGSNGLAPIKAGSSSFYSYIDSSGKEVIQAQFKQAYPFRNGLAAVQTSSGVCKYIDKTGIPVSTKIFGFLRGGHGSSSYYLGSFAKNGLCPATSGSGLSGYIGRDGVFSIEEQFYRVDNFSDSGLAAIETKEYKWGFIDRTGQTVISPQYEDVGSFSTVTIRA